ncbi:MAG: hypothetical protein AM324_008320 [Candidatus Thorarchaeota archaeon SMTZ1-83]
MRTCVKCGRVNQPTRKYCTRCGASLIGVAEDKKPAPATPTREVGTVTTGEQAMASDRVAKPASSVPPVEDPETRLVRPSEVRTDRLRSAERHVEKTEFEKAREVFEQAEEYGVEEGQAGIVETRMLRASEVRELLDSVAEMPQEAAFQTTESPDAFGGAEAPAPSIPTPKDIEQSILGSKSTLVEKEPEPEPTASAAPEISPATTPFSPLESPGAPQTATPSHPPVEPAPVPPPQAQAAPPPTPVTPPPAVPAPPSAPAAPPPQPATTVPERPPFEPKPASDTLDMDLPDPAYRNDPKIKSIHVEIRQSNIELQKLEYEVESIRMELDAEVDRLDMIADQKKTRYENLREQALAAKKEAEEAKKEHSAADKGRAKKMSQEQKRIDKMRKEIQKAEKKRKKRIDELDKEKQRAAEKAARG